MDLMRNQSRCPTIFIQPSVSVRCRRMLTHIGYASSFISMWKSLKVLMAPLCLPFLYAEFCMVLHGNALFLKPGTHTLLPVIFSARIYQRSHPLFFLAFYHDAFFGSCRKNEGPALRG